MCAKEEVRLMNLLHCSNKNSMQSSRTGYLYAHSLSYRQWWCYKVKEVKIRQRVINRGVSHQGLQRHWSAVEGDKARPVHVWLLLLLVVCQATCSSSWTRSGGQHGTCAGRMDTATVPLFTVCCSLLWKEPHLLAGPGLHAGITHIQDTQMSL